MGSRTEICNKALSHLGIGKEISDFDTDQSEEASACRRFYEISRDLTLREFKWPFASRIVALGLVEDGPNNEWLYSYRYPSDCIFFRKILSGVRNDSRQTRVKYKIASDNSGQLIYTDQSDAVAEYSYRETNPEKYPPDFEMALSFLLASYIAPRITTGDNFNIGQRCVQFYQLYASIAKTSAANEECEEELPDSEFISTRE